MTPAFEIVGQGVAKLVAFGSDHRDPAIWWRAVETALGECLAAVDRKLVKAMAVDATSGTVLPVDAYGNPLAQPLMYNDKVADADLFDRIAPVIPAESAAHGPTSGLAKMLEFQTVSGVARIVHQADWIVGRLTGRFDTTDENNALKTGYDPLHGEWPDWIARTGMRTGLLPRVVAPGSQIEPIRAESADAFGLARDVLVVAGTTDGCASFLATGADRPGDGVTALGSTLTLKLLSGRPIFSAEFGIYSHRINGLWLAGGASNSGGKMLAHFFSADETVRLSASIDPATDTGLDYYPLLEAGERFPVMDRAYPPRLTPRPRDDAQFLQGMLEGIANIEKLGYDRLAELGAPALRSVRNVGGGASNPAWTAIRRRKLGVPFLEAASTEAAAGAARLALRGLREAGAL